MYVALDTIIIPTEVFKLFNFGETIKEFVSGVCVLRTVPTLK